MALIASIMALIVILNNQVITNELTNEPINEENIPIRPFCIVSSYVWEGHQSIFFSSSNSTVAKYSEIDIKCNMLQGRDCRPEKREILSVDYNGQILQTRKTYDNTTYYDISTICNGSIYNLSVVDSKKENIFLNNSNFYIVDKLTPIIKGIGNGNIIGNRAYSTTEIYSTGFFGRVSGHSTTVNYPINDVLTFSLDLTEEAPTTIVNEKEFNEARIKYDIRIVRCKKVFDETYIGKPYVLMCMFDVDGINFLSEITSIETVKEYQQKDFTVFITLNQNSMCYVPGPVVYDRTKVC